MPTIVVIFVLGLVFTAGYLTGKNLRIIDYEDKIRELKQELEYLNANYTPRLPKPLEDVK